jgi:uncharacterized RDD family membrane protein YckC
MAAPAPAADLLTARDAPYAGVASRAVALGIDTALVEGTLLVVGALLALIGSLVGGVHLGPIATALTACAWLLVNALYFVTCWSAAGQTAGMRLMRLRVTTADGRTPGVPRSTVRVVLLGLCILFAFAGFIPVLFDARRRGVHDLVAGTVVVYVDP